MDTASLKTPGVYIQEIATFPPSVAEVETAIPAFIGFTELVPTNSVNRITSLVEYVALYGMAENQKDFAASLDAAGNLTIVPGKTSPYIMYYCLQLYFANGGGPAWIASAGAYANAAATGAALASLTGALGLIAKEDEPTLLVFPDAINTLPGVPYYSLLSSALAQCVNLQDRFTIIDVPNTHGDSFKDATEFRNVLNGVEPDTTYGAAYYPFLRTSIPYQVIDTDLQAILVAPAPPAPVVPPQVQHNPDGTVIPAPPAKVVKAPAPAVPNSLQLNQIKQTLANAGMILPPSAAMAGIYARIDKDRGVWKAPANVSVSNVIAPTVKIDDDEQTTLNVDVTAGRSINAIRAFTGKGTLVWGARTLAGNDNEWRYINVRRLFIEIEQSVKRSTYWAVFEPNDANTWVKVRAMIENYLLLKWKDGALAGAKPADAFYVFCGLGTTMTAQDILEGRLIVQVGLAAVRPAEFIILQFFHKLQVS